MNMKHITHPKKNFLNYQIPDVKTFSATDRHGLGNKSIFNVQLNQHSNYKQFSSRSKKGDFSILVSVNPKMSTRRRATYQEVLQKSWVILIHSIYMH
jgi:hypothetical protein